MELSEYSALLTEEYGVEDAALMLVNGIGVLAYTSPDDESVSITAIATQMGYIMEFSFTPIDDEEFKSIAQFMAASIQNVIPEEVFFLEDKTPPQRLFFTVSAGDS